MIDIEIKVANPYKVYINRSSLSGLGKLLMDEYREAKIAIITDSTVDELYGEVAMESLKNAGFSANKFVFPSGEKSKNINTYGEILNFLAQSGITRSDIVLAIGGGVVGDMAGFAAATYMRGIKYIQVPTTLLACVDSSVGGKTAIDLSSGKNLAGAFYQPKAVYVFTELLSSLSIETIADGMGEVVKYAVLSGERVKLLLNNRIKDWEKIIAECVAIKGEIVSCDEFDNGERRLLNLGHTFGHAIEKLTNFTISHGVAVAVGIRYALRVSQKLGVLKSDYQAINHMLDMLGTPNIIYSLEELLPHMALDKKVWQGKLNLVLIVKLGECIVKEVTFDTIKTIAQNWQSEVDRWI